MLEDMQIRNFSDCGARQNQSRSAWHIESALVTRLCA
jgi:hypothetical protein